MVLSKGCDRSRVSSGNVTALVRPQSMRHLQSQEAPRCRVHPSSILNTHRTCIIRDIGAGSPCTATVTADGAPSAKVRRALHGIGDVSRRSVSREVEGRIMDARHRRRATGGQKADGSSVWISAKRIGHQVFDAHLVVDDRVAAHLGVDGI